MDPDRVKRTLGAVTQLNAAGVVKARNTAYKMEHIAVGRAFAKGTQEFKKWPLDQVGGSLAGLRRWVKGENRSLPVGRFYFWWGADFRPSCCF